MKLKSLLASMMACMALAACTNQDLVEDDNIGGDKTGETKAYIGIRIADPANGISRATDDNFSNGKDEEHAITRSLFLFYNADGTFNTKGLITGTIPTTTTGEVGNIEAITVAEIVLKGDPNNTIFPTQVIAFLNLPQEIEEELTNDGGLNLKDAITLVKNAETEIKDYAKDNNFIMTNSVYIEKNGEIIYTTPVTENNIVQTEAMAKQKSITINVERLAAKVEMEGNNVDTPNIAIEHSKNQYKELKLKIDGWGINGVNKTSYLVKNLDDLNGNFGQWSWSDPNNKRSYWAKDTNYDSNANYPTDYENYNPNNSPLEYRSWNDIVSTKYAAQYCPENTMDATAASNINATTYMVIAGHYELVRNDGTTQAIEDKDKLYKYINKYYTEEDMLNLLADQASLYTLSEEGGIETWTKADASHYQLGRASLYDAKLEVSTNEDYYYKENGQYQKYESKEAANAALLKKLGTITTFAGGKTFFYVNIKHLNPTKEQEGHIGIVRNHVYELTLNKIENLGHGVFDPDEDIIITPKEKEFYVAATLKILPWKVVKQDVVL